MNQHYRTHLFAVDLLNVALIFLTIVNYLFKCAPFLSLSPAMYTRVQSVTCLGLPLQKHSNTHARFKLQHCSAAPRLTDLAGVVDYLHTTKPAIVQHPVEDIIELTEGKLNHVYLVTCQGNGKRHQFILKHVRLPS